MLLAQIGAGQPLDRDLAAKCVLALALDRFALARGEAGQEVVESPIAFVEEMELLVGPAQKPAAAEFIPLGLGHERRVDGGGRDALTQSPQTADEAL